MLLGTKLHIPAMRPEWVDRPHLVQRLRDGVERPLTLVDAPAGWGKTTLLASWYAADGAARPFAWVSLDEGDNDPVRSWTYVIAALRTVEPTTGSAALGALRVPDIDISAEVLAAY